MPTSLETQATRVATFAAALVLSAPALAQDAPAEGEPPPPWDISLPQEGDGPLSGYLRLREAEATYRGSEQWWGAYAQIRAQHEAALGLHAEALRMADEAFGGPRDSVGVLPEGVRAVDAVAYLAAAADTVQVVMVNEAHHDAASRLLTLRLLQLLWERGYRYLAAETFAPDSVLLAQPGYPTPQTGHYVDEPVLGALVREALRLGYTLVPYEVEREDEVEGDTLSQQQRRDLSQAQHLAERIFAVDPDAKVLVHAGFGHVYEEVTERWHPMAVYFREITGIDPLTVDQVALAERSASAYEHPRYRAAVVAGLLDDGPVLLFGADDEPLAPVRVAVDVQVLTPRTNYPAGRPAWMAMDGRLVPQPPLVLPAACREVPCLIEVRRADEGDDAVPVDRVVAADEAVVLYVPVDAASVVTVVEGQAGEVLLRTEMLER